MLNLFEDQQVQQPDWLESNFEWLMQNGTRLRTSLAHWAKTSGLYFTTMYQVLIDNLKYCSKIYPLKKIWWALCYRPKHNERRLYHTQDLTVCIWYTAIYLKMLQKYCSLNSVLRELSAAFYTVFKKVDLFSTDADVQRTGNRHIFCVRECRLPLSCSTCLLNYFSN